MKKLFAFLMICLSAVPAMAAEVSRTEAERCLALVNEGESIDSLQRQIAALGVSGTPLTIAEAQRRYDRALESVNNPKVMVPAPARFPSSYFCNGDGGNCTKPMIDQRKNSLLNALKSLLTYANSNNLERINCTAAICIGNSYTKEQLQTEISALEADLAPQKAIFDRVESVLHGAFGTNCLAQKENLVNKNLIYDSNGRLLSQTDEGSLLWAFAQLMRVNSSANEYCYTRSEQFMAIITDAAEKKTADLGAAEKALKYAQLSDKLAKLNECIPKLTEYTACRDGYVCKNRNVAIVAGMSLDENRDPNKWTIQLSYQGQIIKTEQCETGRPCGTGIVAAEPPLAPNTIRTIMTEKRPG